MGGMGNTGGFTAGKINNFHLSSNFYGGGTSKMTLLKITI